MYRRLLLLAMAAAGCGGGSDISRERALELVQEQVLEPAGLGLTDVVVYATIEPLEAGAVVKPVLEVDGSPAVEQLIDRPTWLFWVDQEPFARFAHPTLFVYVDAGSGELTVQEQLWFPVVDGTELLPQSDTDPLRIYGEPEHPDPDGEELAAAGVPAPGKTGPAGVLKHDVLCDGYIALVANAWPNDLNTQLDYDNMLSIFQSRGYTVSPLPPHPAGNESRKQAIMNRLAELAGDRAVPFCQVVFYYVGHGASGNLIMGNEMNGDIQISAEEMANAIALIDACQFTIILDACQSGTFINLFSGILHDILGKRCETVTILTASRGDEYAWTSLFSGGRFTNALVRRLRQTPLNQPIDFARSGTRYQIPAMGLISVQTPQWSFVRPDPGCPCKCCPGTAYCVPDETQTTGVAALSEHLDGTTGLLCAAIDRNVDTGDTLHSSETVPPMPGAGDHTESFAYLGKAVTLDAAQVAAAFNDAYYPCGSGDHGYTLCPAPAPELAAGDYVVVVNALHGPIPNADPVNHYQYGFVFDADGVPDNNYVASAAYPNDFFQNTDRWYEATYSPGDGWSLRATDASMVDLPAVATDARIVMTATTIALIVPASEFAVPAPQYRVTAFRHTGDFGLNPPYDWNGDVEPPTGIGLAPLTP